MRDVIKAVVYSFMRICFVATFGCNQELHLDNSSDNNTLPTGAQTEDNFLDNMDTGNVADWEDPDDPENDPYKPRETIAEGFMGGAMSPGWQSIDNDGGTPAAMWPYYGWEVVSQSACMGCAPGCAISTSAYQPARQADDWLITPPITLGEHNTAVWYGETLWGLTRDVYEMRISTEKPVIEDFLKHPPIFDMSKTAGWNKGGAEGHYGMHAHKAHLDILGYQNQTVYLAIRNNTFNGSVLCIGQFHVRSYEETSSYYDQLLLDVDEIVDRPGPYIDPPEEDGVEPIDPMLYDSCDSGPTLEYGQEIFVGGPYFWALTDDHHWKDEVIEWDSDTAYSKHNGCGYVQDGAPEMVIPFTLAEGEKIVAKETGPFLQVFRIVEQNDGDTCDAPEATCNGHVHYNKSNTISYNKPGDYYLVVESWFDEMGHRVYDVFEVSAGIYKDVPDESMISCNNGFDDDGDGLADCADPDCHEACSVHNLPTFPEETFDMGIPEDWTITTFDREHAWQWCDGSGFGTCYGHIWGSSHDNNLTGGEGGYALFDERGETHAFGERLDTPSIDITGEENFLLRFGAYYFPRSHPNFAYGIVRVSTDGKDWKTVYQFSDQAPHRGNSQGHIQVDITKYVSGSDTMYVRFEYQDNGAIYAEDVNPYFYNGVGPNFQIDDVSISVWD